MAGPDILVHRAAPAVAVVTLNRPRRRNACTLAMWRELSRLFAEVGRDDGVRAVILTGNGGTFCAGADVSEFDAVRGDAGAGIVYEAAVDACYQALLDLPKPTIAAIAGFCIGGGFGLAQVCDFRVAERGAEFGIPAARLGIVYGRRECQWLLALVGLARAKEILFTGARFGAERAARIGFVDRIVERDPLAAAQAFATEMGDSAPLSVAGGKLTLNALAAGDADAQQEGIDALFRAAMDSEDYREGIRAFADKRTPLFRGR